MFNERVIWDLAGTLEVLSDLAEKHFTELQTTFLDPTNLSLLLRLSVDCPGQTQVLVQKIFQNLCKLDMMIEEALEEAVEMAQEEEGELQDILAHKTDLKV